MKVLVEIMKVLSHVSAAEELAKATGKWILFLSFPYNVNDPIEIIKAAPYLDGTNGSVFDEHEACQAIIDGQAFILCDSQDECESMFWQTVGDDGPTKKNSYNGPVRIYALTVSPTEGCMNENT